MRTRVVFSPHRTRREVKTFCPICKKKMKRVLTRECYANGLHNVADTMQKYTKELDREQKRLEKKGVLCGKCESPPRGEKK